MRLDVCTVLVAFLSAVSLSAQDSTLFARMCDGFTSSCIDVSYSYSTVINGIKTAGEGTLLIQGPYYILVGNGVELRSDGSRQWIVDRTSKEVVISNVDRTSFEAVSNPVVLVMDLGRFFDVAGEMDSADGVSVIYKLKPKEKTGIDNAVVEVVRKDASIRRLSFVLEGNIPFDVDIKKYRHVPVRDAGDFTFPSSEFDSSWVVTDLCQ